MIYERSLRYLDALKGNENRLYVGLVKNKADKTETLDSKRDINSLKLNSIKL